MRSPEEKMKGRQKGNRAETGEENKRVKETKIRSFNVGIVHIGGKKTRTTKNAIVQRVVSFKVHLTPKFFFRLKKSSCFGDYFFEKIFGFGKILEFLCPIEVRKIAAILARGRVSKIKGLATTVTSLREPNNLYFALFRTIHLLHLEG